MGGMLDEKAWQEHCEKYPMAKVNNKSTVGCGCDEGANHLCAQHYVPQEEQIPVNPQWADVGYYPYPKAKAVAESAWMDRELCNLDEVYRDEEADVNDYTADEETFVLLPEPSFTISGVTVETRITDPLTGGQKGSKLQRFSLIPAEFLWALAEHYGVGARKYEDRNWERGYKWSLSQDAHDRHLNQWLRGENNDPETGTNHLIAAAWHLIALFIYQLRGLGTDDIRRKQ
jgi:hypothetical protein